MYTYEYVEEVKKVSSKISHHTTDCIYIQVRYKIDFIFCDVFVHAAVVVSTF